MALNLNKNLKLYYSIKEVAEIYATAENLLNHAYQNHLSRLKYCDVNSQTGRQGVYNMGRNVVFKVVVPISL